MPYQCQKGFMLVDLLLSLCVVSALMIVQLSILMPKQVQAVQVSVLASVQPVKTDLMIDYFIHGEWSHEKHPVSSVHASDAVKSIQLDGAAIHVFLADTLQEGVGTVMSYRPAVWFDDGPVRWICDDMSLQSSWHVYGDNKTDVQNRSLLRTVCP